MTQKHALNVLNETRRHQPAGRPVSGTGEARHGLERNSTAKTGLALQDSEVLRPTSAALRAAPGTAWERYFLELLAFKKKHGHCCPAERAGRLGSWVVQQRMSAARGTLEPERVRRLDELGFCWSVWDDAWERGYHGLKSYIEENGHGVVSMGTHPKLATWMAEQRKKKASGRLAPERVRRLEALSFQWCLEEDPWEGHFVALARFKAVHGHCRPKKTEFLNAWAANQRKAKASGRLAPERARRLEALGFQWNVISDLWERQFERLVDFKRKTGHASPPKRLGTLGTWAVMQRLAKAKGQIDPERERRLEEIGFKWDPMAEHWEARFAELVAFKAEHGHCFMGKTSLGNWAANQRRHKARGRLAPEYVKRLEEIGFPWESKRPAEQDDDLVDLLLEFFREHGHFSVPNAAPHEELHRRTQDRLSALCNRPRFKQELLQLGFPVGQDEWGWERSFASVKAFRGRNGHSRLPEGSALRRWLDEQRELAAREDLDLDREARLKNAGILASSGGAA